MDNALLSELKECGLGDAALNYLLTNVNLTTDEKIRKMLLVKPVLTELGYDDFEIARIALGVSKGFDIESVSDKTNEVLAVKPILKMLGLSELEIAQVALGISTRPEAKITRFLAEAVEKLGIDIANATEEQIRDFCEVARGLAKDRQNAIEKVAEIFSNSPKLQSEVPEATRPAEAEAGVPSEKITRSIRAR
jgi:hypothetical protein